MKTLLTAALLVLGFSLAKAETAKAPNIVFIAVDDLTYKYLGVFGANIQTPHIDGLAKRGVLFEDSVVQGTMCSPSRNSTMTALYPHNLGLYSNGNIKQMPADTWALPKGLQTAGYHTSWIGKSHILPNTDAYEGRNGVKKTKAMHELMGFDEVWQSAGRHVALKKARELVSGEKWKPGIDSYADYLHEKGLIQQFVNDATKPTTLAIDDYLDGHVAKRTVDWIDAYQNDKPFFLWVNFSGPHGPYDPPAKYLEMYQPEDMPPVITDDDTADIPACLRPHLWKKKPEAIMPQRAQYAGMITFIDEQVGRVLTAIDTKGITDQTMIVFYSDHGIMEGDHGLFHKETFYKEVLNAALIIAGPGCKAGKRVRRPVELLDIAKTALASAGASESEQAKAYGHSLLPLLSGEGEFKRSFAIAELEKATALVTGDYKYIETDEGPVLFDRKNDPNELDNVADQHPDICTKLQKRLDNWKSAHGPRIEPTQKSIGER